MSRFQALKSRPSVVPNSSSHSLSPPQNSQKSTTSSVDEDELFARFVALKGSHGIPADPRLLSSCDDDAAEDEEDEVEKLIQWAKDATRLERSLLSDDDRATLAASGEQRERASNGRMKKGRR
ncbi:uncharacterized protein LOC133863372 [Alnus glutinosa]|uniref:uncharacterized protein LOC133863372 n=1 Tax=Alnus glutinosa TaxID=3517 RepID=UPI002D79B6D6|nr:uncharacterized protein LOC133863372 [Alnus glutinosa]